MSEESQEAWSAAIRRYEERIERVEARMTARLRDQLGTAKNANEMFRIFSRLMLFLCVHTFVVLFVNIRLSLFSV